MCRLHIFIDGSVSAQHKVGYGAFLAVTDLNSPVEQIKLLVNLKRFEQTSSTKLELQTLLWALNHVITMPNSDQISLVVYSDSQTIIGLPQRRVRLEQHHYCSSKNKALNLGELYQEFYRLISSLNCELVKVVGHQTLGRKNGVDKLFCLVDRASRRALRENLSACILINA